MLELLLAKYCAPALAGMKAANLVTCFFAQIPDLKNKIRALNQTLNAKNIYLVPICECERRVLLLVFRKELLCRYLKRDEIHALLVKAGYPEAFCLDAYLAILKERLKHSAFPHEIGAFLGYPADDITGFIRHKGENCLLCGEWKVYHNAARAKAQFARYARCKSALTRRVSQGDSLCKIFCAS